MDCKQIDRLEQVLFSERFQTPLSEPDLVFHPSHIARNGKGEFKAPIATTENLKRLLNAYGLRIVRYGKYRTLELVCDDKVLTRERFGVSVCSAVKDICRINRYPVGKLEDRLWLIASECSE